MSGAAADPYDLGRFLEAQGPVYGRVLAELGRGRKESHWMWFVFPQLRGLARSATAVRYAIASRAEAEAYVAHPTLGHRLRECAGLVAAIPARPVVEIFAPPDDLKLRSSMTLFAAVDPGCLIFRAVLDRFFGGQDDPETLRLLAG